MYGEYVYARRIIARMSGCRISRRLVFQFGKVTEYTNMLTRVKEFSDKWMGVLYAIALA